MQSDYEDKGVVLLALSHEPATKVTRYVKEHELTYIVGAAAKPTHDAYGVKSYPTMFVVDPDGVVVWTGHGPSEAEAAVQRVLKENPPKHTERLKVEAARNSYAKAVKLQERKKYAEAIEAYEAVVKDFKGSNQAKQASAALKKLKGDKQIMAQVRKIEAKKDCESWLRMARALAKNGKEDEARKYYRRVIKEYGETKYADIAREEMAEL